MSLLVKICGLKTPETLVAALNAGADLVGFVFFPASPRHVGDEAAELGKIAGGRATKVALTVDADDRTIEGIIAALRPDVLQLHGKESPERVLAIKKRFGLPVMKAIPVEVHSDLGLVTDYADVADRLLFDARAPREATRPGGLGRKFDWRLLENVDPGMPFMLSGGLDSDNIAEALRLTRAGGVDVSSGVERVPGEKDVVKIGAFVRAARKAAEATTPSRSMSPA
ncbi:MAG TPA: phosphoribosylanthranilate isomerase [Xanthobacteraceae bacterium]|jgi:phosphoribosylanthranilate isomerase